MINLEEILHYDKPITCIYVEKFLRNKKQLRNFEPHSAISYKKKSVSFEIGKGE